MVYHDGTLITGHSGHEIYIIDNGQRRWVPDAWTMQDLKLTPRNIKIVSDEVLDAIPETHPIESTLPAPRIPAGTLVETERAVFEVEETGLRYVNDPRLLTGVDRPDRSSVFLPEALVRPLLPAPARGPDGGGGGPAIPATIGRARSQPPAQAPAQKATVVASTAGDVHTDLGANHHMWTSAQLFSNNLLLAATRTASFTWFGGFTGGVVVAVVDANGMVIALTEQKTFGVSGTAFGNSDRFEGWSHQFPTDLMLADQAHALVPIHHWAPTWRLLGPLIEVGKFIIGAFG
jgi:hypothetical protein